MTVSALAQRVRDAARGPGRYLLGIAGPPGAGKSTLAAALRDSLGSSAAVAPMDGFHLSNAALRRSGMSARKGEPDTFDVAGFAAAVERLRETSVGEPVPWPTFDRTLDEPTPGGVVICDESVAIVEGNYLLLWSAVRAQLDECWYLDVDFDVLAPRLRRRFLDAGWPADEVEQKVAGSDLRNARLVAATKASADLVIVEHQGVYSM